jgi:multidrug transporter EmrE-like cation transporter
MQLSYIWLSIAVLTSALPIPMIKKYTIDNDIKWLILASVLFVVLVIAYANILKTNNISTAYPLVKITSIIFVAVFGLVLFGEKLRTTEIIGIILGIGSIYLLTK